MPFLSQTKKKTRDGACPLNGVQKFGFVALVFFTIKGILWLLVPALIALSL